MVLHGAGMLQARSGGEPSPRASSTRRTSPRPSSGSRRHAHEGRTDRVCGRCSRRVGLNTSSRARKSQSAPEFLSRMKALGEAAGGDAPLPEASRPAHVQDIAQRVGNDQLKAIHDHKDRLTQEIADWKARRRQDRPAAAPVGAADSPCSTTPPTCRSPPRSGPRSRPSSRTAACWRTPTRCRAWSRS